MKNRFLILISMIPLLIGCNKDNYIGEYAFQMGKTKDTHLGVSLELSKEYYDKSITTKGQKFTLSLDVSSAGEDSDFIKILDEFNPLTGYYRVNKQEKVYEQTRLNLGISILGEYDIPEEITELIFVASITSSVVNFYLPVSINDLLFQLYWYGYDFSFENILDDDDTNDNGIIVTAHPVGSHPSQEEIDEINKTYLDNHSSPFRDYHVLKLGLSKK